MDVEICDDSDPDEATQGQSNCDIDRHPSDISRESTDACKEPAFIPWQNGPVECLENTRSSSELRNPGPDRHAFNPSTSSHLRTCIMGRNPTSSHSKLSPNHADVPSKRRIGCHGNNCHTSRRVDASIRPVIYDIRRADSEELANTKANERVTHRQLYKRQQSGRGNEDSDESSHSTGRELGFSEEITKHVCVQTSARMKGRKRKRLGTYFDFNMYL